MLSFAKYEDISQIARTVRILAIPVRPNTFHANSDATCEDKRKEFTNELIVTPLHKSKLPRPMSESYAFECALANKPQCLLYCAQKPCRDVDGDDGEVKQEPGPYIATSNGLDTSKALTLEGNKNRAMLTWHLLFPMPNHTLISMMISTICSSHPQQLP